MGRPQVLEIQKQKEMIEPIDLQQIIDTDLPILELEGYITDATAFAARVGINDEMVVKYLAAHLLAYTRQRPVQSEEAGGAKVVYSGVFGTGLMATPYGQLAVEMDTTGALNGLSKPNISMTAL